MAAPIRVGILGAGAFASRRHLPELVTDDRVAVVAACRRDPEQLARFADHFAIPERFQDWREMLDKVPLDGVLIATPHDQHFTQAKAALEGGLHVLLEKPIALTRSEAEILAALAQENHKTLLVAFNPPYWRHTHALHAGIAAGWIGDLEAIDIRWVGSAAAVFGKAPLPETLPGLIRPTLFRADVQQAGGGNLMDGGGHLLSELLWVTGRQPLEVGAMMDQTPGDMRAVLTIRLEGGLLATITAVADSGHSMRRLRSIYEGSRGTALAEGLPYRVTWQKLGQAEEYLPEESLPPVPTPVSDWIACLQSQQVPLGTAAHGVWVTRLLQAAYESARTARSVNV